MELDRCTAWRECAQNGSPGYNFVDDTDDPFDDNGHGTPCAGTIGAYGNNGSGIVGVNWRTQIMALKFLDAGGSGSTSDAIKCIDYAIEHGAQVLSNSWGGGGFSPELAEAITRAESAGAIFVAAAGNTPGNNNDINPEYPASYSHANIISVCAIEPGEDLAWFSCFGPTSVDIGAPGEDIFSTYPNNQFQSLDGSSMATPHVSGACALVWAHPSYQGASWQQIRQAVLNAAQPNARLSGKCVTGGNLHIGFLQEGCGTPPGPIPGGHTVSRRARHSLGRMG